MKITLQQQAELLTATARMQVAATLATACAAHGKTPAEMVGLYRETSRALREKPQPAPTHDQVPSST